MLAIKLKRIGKKHQASFRVVVNERRSKANGKFVEDLGWLNPHTSRFQLNEERINYWVGVGAKPTDTVYNLLIRAGIIKAKKISVHSFSKKKKEEDSKVEEVKTEDKEKIEENPTTDIDTGKEKPNVEIKEEAVDKNNDTKEKEVINEKEELTDDKKPIEEEKKEDKQEDKQEDKKNEEISEEKSQ